MTLRILHALLTLRSISAAETVAFPLHLPQLRKVNMAYTKLVSALARANSTNVNKMLVPPGRYRSTMASAKSQEERSQLDGCAVVEAEPVELISQNKRLPKAHIYQVNVDFNNTQEAYKSKRNIELIRSLLVFRLCAIDTLVEKNKEVSLKTKVFVVVAYVKIDVFILTSVTLSVNGADEEVVRSEDIREDNEDDLLWSVCSRGRPQRHQTPDPEEPGFWCGGRFGLQCRGGSDTRGG